MLGFYKSLFPIVGFILEHLIKLARAFQVKPFQPKPMALVSNDFIHQLLYDSTILQISTELPYSTCCLFLPLFFISYSFTLV